MKQRTTLAIVVVLCLQACAQLHPSKDYGDPFGGILDKFRTSEITPPSPGDKSGKRHWHYETSTPKDEHSLRQSENTTPSGKRNVRPSPNASRLKPTDLVCGFTSDGFPLICNNGKICGYSSEGFPLLCPGQYKGPICANYNGLPVYCAKSKDEWVCGHGSGGFPIYCSGLINGQEGVGHTTTPKSVTTQRTRKCYNVGGFPIPCEQLLS